MGEGGGFTPFPLYFKGVFLSFCPLPFASPQAPPPPSFLLPPPPSFHISNPPMSTAGNANRSKNPLDFDFSEPEALTRYVTETGKILPRKLTGLTAAQQRHVTKAIKRARCMLTMK